MTRPYDRVLAFAVVLAGLAFGAGMAGADPDAPASRQAIAAYREALSDWQSGRQQKAISGFARAAELAPRWGAPNARLGLIYQLQGHEAEARAQYAVTQEASLGEPRQVTEDETKLRALLIANEAYTVYLINASRLAQGLAPLAPDATLGIVARRHSEEMRDKHYFSHDSPTPKLRTCQDRFNAVFGYRPRLIGENVARRWGSLFCLTEEKILGTHNDLMTSPGHRRNILLDSIEWLGVGLAVNANGDYWLTEVFVEPGR
ncbi:MAG: CAP domain-containing protein [Armatimonadetes bacterium]|nr:CAP domain-containing protein [Armatimonadota bacterium]